MLLNELFSLRQNLAGIPGMLPEQFLPQMQQAAFIGPPTVTVSTMPHPALGATPIIASPTSNVNTSPSQSNAPCSTLFVANLGSFCSEQELKDLFTTYVYVYMLYMYVCYICYICMYVIYMLYMYVWYIYVIYVCKLYMLYMYVWYIYVICYMLYIYI